MPSLKPETLISRQSSQTVVHTTTAQSSSAIGRHSLDLRINVHNLLYEKYTRREKREIAGSPRLAQHLAMPGILRPLNSVFLFFFPISVSMSYLLELSRKNNSCERCNFDLSIKAMAMFCKGLKIISPRGEVSWTHWSGNLQACLYHNATVIETRDEPYLLRWALNSRQTCR